MWSKNLIFATILLLFWNKVCSAGNEIDLSCRTTSDCKIFESQNITVSCKSDKCECVGPRDIWVECKPIKILQITNQIGGPCPCTIENSDCDSLSKLCMCKKSFTSSADNLRCIKRVVPLGEKCEDNSQCLRFDTNSECFHTICKCQFVNFTRVNNACLKVLSLDSTCTSNQECDDHTKHSVCTNDKRLCVCDHGYVANILSTACLPVANYEENCTDTNQCRSGVGVGSICNSGICVCDAMHYKHVDKINDNVMCMKIMRPGDACEQHNECFNGTHGDVMECLTGECHCRSNFNRENYYCYKQSGSSSLKSVGKFAILSIVGLFMISF